MSTRQEARLSSPPLPTPRGPLSAGVVSALRHGQPVPGPEGAAGVDPYGDDLQLALYVLYELHYQGFEGVDEEREWDPGLLALRRALEQSFLAALRADVPRPVPVQEALDDLQIEPVGHDETSVSHYLQREGEPCQLAEYAALRSLYHLKEADPHAWVIPRLHGRAKAAMVAVEYDEFGAGRPEEIHARLFADLMDDLGLETAYGHYLDAAPAAALATVNLMSLFGLHRALRGALVGHFAAVEVTSSPGSRRLAKALRRIGAGPAAIRFYDEHVEADAVHEQVVRHDVVGGLLESEPALERDVVFGVQATTLLEDRLGAVLLAAWRDGSSALRIPPQSRGQGQVLRPTSASPRPGQEARRNEGQTTGPR
ncbi:iron-containing redox enzyme family protein [Streptomyces sp. NPDC060027]|uniref:iron-containing redox enzyme family protein n=1 Tax=Streptomyces sp. NPDC060027 TaxID=3347040 RepID=UPI0036AC272D